MFHLGWFAGGLGLQNWRGTWSGTNSQSWMKPDLYVDFARSLERACMDYILFEDGLMVGDHYQNSMAAYLKHGLEVPRLDPTAMIGILGQATSRIGLLPTMSTSFYPPFMAARMLATLDHLTNGRAGGNLVTSSSHRSAQNFGQDRHMEHDMRYVKAAEWMDVVNQLLDSWEPDAVVMDKEKGIFADHKKVHPINFEGQFFKVRGPLNVPPGPQVHPVIAQAGGSPAGRAFAAANADTIMCVPFGVEAMKQYRDDVSAQMIAAGRKPTDCKVMYLIQPFIAETDSAARDLYDADQAARRSDHHLEYSLAVMSYFSQLDLSEFNLDEPMPDLTGKVNGHQSSMTRYAKDAAKGQKTLRELIATHNNVASIDLVGSPDTVAQMMGEAMEYAGGDGFLFSMGGITRRNIATICDGLVPALQKRGLTRTHYEFEHFKDNLLAF